MSDAELIARLRDAKRDWPEFGHDRADAADRIEELTAKLAKAVAELERLGFDSQCIVGRELMQATIPALPRPMTPWERHLMHTTYHMPDRTPFTPVVPVEVTK